MFFHKRLMHLAIGLLLGSASTWLQAVPAPIIIDIDNPKFRKLVIAAPRFTTTPENDAELARYSERAKTELDRLLAFTGYFQTVQEAAYADILRNPPTEIKISLPGFEGIDLLKWKSIGVEALTLGKLTRSGQGKVRIELRAADILKGERLLSTAYTVGTMQELDDRLKTFVDQLMSRYTGKPGIFSSQIVFIGRRTKASAKQVFVCDVDGRNVTQISFEETAHLSPSWSPDGQKILFTSFRDGKADLYMFDRQSNKAPAKIAGNEGINSGGVYSPNGRLIAYTGSVSTDKGNTQIYIKTSEGRDRVPLLQGHGIEVDPAFSPDGKYLAFVSGRYGNPHIFRADLNWSGDGAAATVLGDKRLTYAGWYNATPAWSPDSQKLAFAGFDKDINRFDLFLMNSDGTNLERLTIRSGDNESPSWSPNGQLIIFHSNRTGTADIKGRNQLYMMNRDGSNQRLISTGLYDAQTPKWGPNVVSSS